MKTQRIFTILILLGALPAWAAFDIDMLMVGLSQHQGGKAEFVEKRYSALLEKPVISRGEMTYTTPNRLVKVTIEPRAESIVLDGDTLSLERGQRKIAIHLSNRPEARAFVDSIRSTLAGNRSALEKNYLLLLSGTQEEWRLVLTPTESKISALLKKINISGNGKQIREIEYIQIDDDRTVLQIKPLIAQ